MIVIDIVIIIIGTYQFFPSTLSPDNHSPFEKTPVDVNNNNKNAKRVYENNDIFKNFIIKIASMVKSITDKLKEIRKKCENKVHKNRNKKKINNSIPTPLYPPSQTAPSPLPS